VDSCLSYDYLDDMLWLSLSFDVVVQRGFFKAWRRFFGDLAMKAVGGCKELHPINAV
jgi:hypothetical protein